MCDHFVYILGPVKGYQNEMAYTVFKKLCYSLKQRKVRQPYYIDPIVLQLAYFWPAQCNRISVQKWEQKVTYLFSKYIKAYKYLMCKN